MIAIVGGNNITLKRIMRGMGFVDPTLAVRHTLQGVFNTSFPPGVMQERVPAWVRQMPMINETIITNKMNALVKMKNSGLSEFVPEMSTDLKHEGNWIVKPYASQAGAGIDRYRLGAPIPLGYYIQRDVSKFREFRAHVGLWLDNPVFSIQEKKPKPELWESKFSVTEYAWPCGSIQRDALPVTWNIESGFYFRRSTTPEDRAEKVQQFPLFRRIEELGIKAVKALGYQYGAVDILMNEERELFVTEVNSHPAIKNPESVRIYQVALEPLKHFTQGEFINLVSGVSSTTQHSMTRRYEA